MSPQNSDVEALTPSVTGSGDGVLRKQLKLNEIME